MTDQIQGRRCVLVTGAAGFIGSHVTDRLLADGWSVAGVDNFDPFYPRRLKEANLAAARGDAHFQFREGDLRDASFMDELFAELRPRAVVHLAARAGVRPSIEDPRTYNDLNVMGTVRTLEAMTKAGVGKLLFGSSSSVYGEVGAGRPSREDDPADHPVSPYAATKRTGELLCHTYQYLYGVSCYCLRLFTVYGPRQRPDLAVHRFTCALERGEPLPIYGDGSAVRDFTYVGDTVEGIARALAKLLEDDEAAYEIINLGAGRTISVQELVRTLGRVMGVEPRVEHLPEQAGDVARTWADIDKARTVLGYEPTTSLEEGLERFVAWYRRRDERA